MANRSEDTVQISMYGSDLIAPSEAFMVSYSKTGTIYEPHVIKNIVEYMRPGMTFIDIGANVGAYTITIAKLVGNEGRVIAVEADHRNARCIVKSVALNKLNNVTVWPVAATSALKTEAVLLDSKTNSGVRDLHKVEEREFDLVLGMPIDILVKTGKVDVIKIDIEGREYPAMLGMQEIIHRDNPIVFTEFTPHAMPGVSGNQPGEFLDFFFKRGYVADVLHVNTFDIIQCKQDQSAVMSLIDHPDFAKYKYLDIRMTPNQLETLTG